MFCSSNSTVLISFYSLPKRRNQAPVSSAKCSRTISEISVSSCLRNRYRSWPIRWDRARTWRHDLPWPHGCGAARIRPPEEKEPISLGPQHSRHGSEDTLPTLTWQQQSTQQSIRTCDWYTPGPFLGTHPTGYLHACRSRATAAAKGLAALPPTTFLLSCAISPCRDGDSELGIFRTAAFPAAPLSMRVNVQYPTRNIQ